MRTFEVIYRECLKDLKSHPHFNSEKERDQALYLKFMSKIIKEAWLDSNEPFDASDIEKSTGTNYLGGKEHIKSFCFSKYVEYIPREFL